MVTEVTTEVNWSFALVAEVPPGPTTVTSTVPAEPAGAVAVIEVALTTVKVVAAAVPNFTAVVPVKLVPVMVTEVPPVVDPEVGLTAVTVGGEGGTKVNWSFALVAEVPPGPTTVTSTVPAAPAGAVAVIEVALTTVKVEAAVAPNFTAVAPVKLVPVMVTEVPPVVVPEFGLTPETVGAGGRTKVNWSFALVAEVPPGVVTVTSTVPAAPAGAVAVIEVALTTVKVEAAVAPNFTAVAPVKLVPVMVTEVPPPVEPEVGLTPVTVGAAT
jgi:hypothetical protein